MKTLILIDLQRDFLPGGALGIPGADGVIPIINRMLPRFDHVVATQDWHPSGHISFASAHGKKAGEIIRVGEGEQILWPDHCIQNTQGAEWADSLNARYIEAVFYKGSDPNVDSYSGFFDHRRERSTGLAAYLQKHRLKELYFAGLATEYCVFYSVIDALELGFAVWVVRDGCKGINLHSGDEERAFQTMRFRGAQLIFSGAI